MKNLLITEIGNVTSEGISLHFNQRVSMNGGISTDEWWVSWDKIGKSLLPAEYCDKPDVSERDRIRMKEAER